MKNRHTFIGFILGLLVIVAHQSIIGKLVRSIDGFNQSA